jgi:5-methylcytosine-specific restriction protein A
LRDNTNRWVYDSKAWKLMRSGILANEPLCRICKASGKLKPARHVDHIIPISKGGEPFEYSNAQPLCVEHHSLKTAEDEGKTARWGCDAQGNPLSPKSHWNQTQ